MHSQGGDDIVGAGKGIFRAPLFNGLGGRRLDRPRGGESRPALIIDGHLEAGGIEGDVAAEAEIKGAVRTQNLCEGLERGGLSQCRSPHGSQN